MEFVALGILIIFYTSGTSQSIRFYATTAASEQLTIAYFYNSCKKEANHKITPVT